MRVGSSCHILLYKLSLERVGIKVIFFKPISAGVSGSLLTWFSRLS